MFTGKLATESELESFLFQHSGQLSIDSDVEHTNSAGSEVGSQPATFTAIYSIEHLQEPVLSYVVKGCPPVEVPPRTQFSNLIPIS